MNFGYKTFLTIQAFNKSFLFSSYMRFIFILFITKEIWIINLFIGFDIANDKETI